MDFTGRDFLKGMVYSAIWTANVKHVTNSASAIRKVLPDDVRKPVSVMAVANSLRLPYETARRYAMALVEEGICVRAGRQGLVVTETAHRALQSNAVKSYELVLDFLTELRRAGIAV